MRFYGWNWEYMMGMSLRLFWTMVKSMHRIKAADNLRAVQISSFSNLAEDSKKEYIAAQHATLGTIAVTDERDVEGLNKLRDL